MQCADIQDGRNANMTNLLITFQTIHLEKLFWSPQTSKQYIFHKSKMAAMLK